MSKIHNTFTIHQIIEDGKPQLIIAPAEKSDGYDPVQIEVSSFQWDALRFNFMTKHGAPNGTELNYIS